MSMTFEVGSLWSLCPLRGVGVGVAEAYRALHVAMSAKIPNASILVCQGHISMIFEVGFPWGLDPLEGHPGGGRILHPEGKRARASGGCHCLLTDLVVFVPVEI